MSRKLTECAVFVCSKRENYDGDECVMTAVVVDIGGAAEFGRLFVFVAEPKKAAQLKRFHAYGPECFLQILS
jgi:hypothetical protein